MEHLWKMGYSAEDLISNIFRVCKNLPIEETLKLDFVKVSRSIQFSKRCKEVMRVCKNTNLELISGNWNNSSRNSGWN